MYKLIIVSIYFLIITGCNSQKVVKESTALKSEHNSLEKIIEKLNYKNPRISYNSNKSYVLCTNEFQGNRLASRIDFFIYNLKDNILVKKGSVIGDIYWEDDYTITLVPYVGMVSENKTINENTKKSVKKIHLEK